MPELLGKLYRVIDPKDHLKALLLALLMLAAALVQSTGIVSIVPFLAVLSNPDIIEKNSLLFSLYGTLGFTDRGDFLFFLGITAFLIFSLGTGLQATNLWCTTRFANSQQYKLSQRLMADYLRKPYSFFLSKNSADLGKTVLHETMAAVNGVLLPGMQLCSHFFVAVALVSILIFTNPLLAFSIAAMIGGFYALIFFISRQWLTNIGEETVKANSERFRVAGDCFAGAKEIRLLGREQAYLEQYQKPSRRWATVQAYAKLVSQMPIYLMEAITFGGVMLVILYLMEGTSDLGNVLPLLGLYGLAGRQLIPTFNKIFSAVSEMRYNLPALDKVLADLTAKADTRVEFIVPETVTPVRLTRAIRFDRVSFSYVSAKRPALNALTLEMKARTSIGIVGYSGAGKSTLIDILLGLLSPSSGRISIDEKALEDVAIPSWRLNIGYVPQHIFLADRSIAENIALGLPLAKIDNTALERASIIANLHDFICKELPQGYSTLIGDRGIRLSGGQRQRIGIARALYRDPDFLVFDEATSALDNETERSVMEAIEHLSGKKTILIVAHRLSSLKNCSKIVVLDEGRVVQEGRWEELESCDGIFKELLQAVDKTAKMLPSNSNSQSR